MFVTFNVVFMHSEKNAGGTEAKNDENGERRDAGPEKNRESTRDVMREVSRCGLTTRRRREPFVRMHTRKYNETFRNNLLSFIYREPINVTR